MIVKTINGNLIDLAYAGAFHAIVHGCNCFNSFGAGIALEIKNRIPGAWEADRVTIRGYKHKLGCYSVCKGVPDKSRTGFDVINAYTQYHWRATLDDPAPVRLDAIKQVFSLINSQYAGKVIGIPRIGAGLAGGNWDEIAQVINSVTPDICIVLVNYSEV